MSTNISVETRQGQQGQPPRAGAYVFSEQEAVAFLGPAEVSKHKGQRLVSMTLPLGSVALGAGGKAPERVKLFSYGGNETTKGAFYLSEKHAPGILQAEESYGNDLVIDLDHKALQGDSRAVGWFSLELADDGLYAGKPRNTEQEGLEGIWWLKSGRELVESFEYRYISPVFWTTYDDEGREVIVEVLNFSLTNIPATKNRAPLINSRAPEQAPEQAGALTPQQSPELQQARADLDNTRAALQQAERRLTEGEVDGLIRAGRLPPALREKALSLSAEVRAEVLRFLEGTPLPATMQLAEHPSQNSDTPEALAAALTPEELEHCKRFKVDPAEYAATMQALYPGSPEAKRLKRGPRGQQP